MGMQSLKDESDERGCCHNELVQRLEAEASELHSKLDGKGAQLEEEALSHQQITAKLKDSHDELFAQHDARISEHEANLQKNREEDQSQIAKIRAQVQELQGTEDERVDRLHELQSDVDKRLKELTNRVGESRSGWEARLSCL